MSTMRSPRPPAVIAAVFLVLVPTGFTVFPELGQWALVVRIPIAVLWLVAAFVAARSAVVQSEQLEQLAGEPLSRRDRLREVAAARLLRDLLRPGASGFPETYNFKVFLPDESADRMIPAFDPTGIDESRGWIRGQGATGLAWESNSRVLITGATTHDGSLGLTPEQQARSADLAVVAAMPIRTARDRVIGVLSVTSTIDDGFAASEAGLLAHLELAEVVGRVLVDMLRGGRE